MNFEDELLSPGMACMPKASRELARRSPGTVCMPGTCREQMPRMEDAVYKQGVL
ncbi:MAG: hypothetical protein M0Q44_03395 [Methylobacter sp.]|jgi:hypothetical protein|nr:hypothetical protein [Methylobacter sp.]